MTRMLTQWVTSLISINHFILNDFGAKMNFNCLIKDEQDIFRKEYTTTKDTKNFAVDQDKIPPGITGQELRPYVNYLRVSSRSS